MKNALRIAASLRIAATLALALAAAHAGAAGTLYKSVGPNGVIQFSDVPPGESSMLVERRPIESLNSVHSPNTPSHAMNVAHSLEADEAIARANAQVDLAEHALALARRTPNPELEGLRLAPQRVSLSDAGRIEYYKRGVLVARQYLLDLLRERNQPTLLASR